LNVKGGVLRSGVESPASFVALLPGSDLLAERGQIVRFDVRKLALLLWLAVPAAAGAQLWSGPAAVEVRAEDPKGHALAGAQVLLQYTSLNPKDGPPPVATDSRGHADVGGLAEGSWHLEVSHDGFMTYMAEITVRRGRPELVEATQFRVPGGGTSLMKVKISRGSATAPPPMRAAAPPAQIPAPPPAPAPTPAPPAPKVEAQPAPQAEVRPTPQPSQPQPAPAPPIQPAPQPVPQPQAAPPPPVQEAPAAPPQPRPETPAPTAPTTPAPAPMQAAPPPAPPAAAPMPAPTAPAVPAPPAVDAVRLRTAKDRTCFECKPGEAALSTEKVIPPGGGPGCGDLAARLKGGEVPGDLPAGCRVLRIVLPAGMRYIGYRYEIQDQGASLDCASGKDCPQSTGRWPIDPVLVRDPQGTIVLAPFEAGPAERERRAVLTAYFTAGKK
jgi:hypothetical protein